LVDSVSVMGFDGLNPHVIEPLHYETAIKGSRARLVAGKHCHRITPGDYLIIPFRDASLWTQKKTEEIS
jgi:hypothetical protein